MADKPKMKYTAHKLQEEIRRLVSVTVTIAVLGGLLKELFDVKGRVTSKTEVSLDDDQLNLLAAAANAIVSKGLNPPPGGNENPAIAPPAPAAPAPDPAGTSAPAPAPDPEPAPSGDPAEGGASASSPSPAAPATLDDLTLDEIVQEFRSDPATYTPANLFTFIMGAVQVYHEQVPDSHPLITDLHNSAKRLIQAIIVEKVVPNVTHPNDEILVKLLSNDHPTADQATINIHLTVAYQEVCG